MRRRRRVVVFASLLAAVVVAGLVFGAVRVLLPAPAPNVAVALSGDVAAGGSPAAIVLPVQGSLALAASGPDLVQQGSAPLLSDGGDVARPIASVAKTLTALTVVDRMPLGAHQSGPEYEMTQQDVGYYTAAVAAGGSATFVSAGEQFSERQLLEALLVPSGNNIADTLAAWISGSVAAFLTLESSTAQSLGMTHTTITDPSGLDPATQSTANDLVRLGAAVIANPVLSAIVAEPAVRLPSGDTVANLDTALSQPGWLGIKTGDSTAAGGCMLFAARRRPAGDANPGDAITIVGAVLGERSELVNATGDDDRAAAIYDAERAVDSAMQGFVVVRPDVLTGMPSVAGMITTAWGDAAPIAVDPPSAALSTVVRSGTSLTLAVVQQTVSAPVVERGQVASIVGLAGSRAAVSWPIIAESALPGPGIVWRLQHG